MVWALFQSSGKSKVERDYLNNLPRRGTYSVLASSSSLFAIWYLVFVLDLEEQASATMTLQPWPKGSVSESVTKNGDILLAGLSACSLCIKWNQESVLVFWKNSAVHSVRPFLRGWAGLEKGGATKNCFSAAMTATHHGAKLSTGQEIANKSCQRELYTITINKYG